MSKFQFHKATKSKSKLRLALIGPAGSGKTYTALKLATAMGKRVAVIDTERGSASKYADLFPFEVLELETFAPGTYAEAIRAASDVGFDVLVIDSLSHAWTGKEGALEQVDRAAVRSQSKNSFTAWREVTPQHNAMVDAILQAPMHLITTMRAKMEYVMEKDERTGKTTPKKIGLAPVQRDGLEYEFDVVADMDLDNNLIVSKTRCPLLSGKVIAKPDENLAKTLMTWLSDGAEAPTKPAPTPPTEAKPVNRNGNGSKAKPQPPANGQEFLRRMTDKETELVRTGQCKPGDMLRYIQDGAKIDGIQQDFSKWGPHEIKWGMEAASHFLNNLKPEKVA